MNPVGICPTLAPVTLLVLDNALDHGFYRPVEHWARLAGFEPESVHAAGGASLPAPGKHSHVIVTGSEDTITDRPPWAEAEAVWVAEAVRRGARVLGSCWGHQLVAVALAGPGAVRRSATPELGWLTVTVHDGGELLEPGPVDVFCSHFDEVVPACHPDLHVLADSPGCAVQAMRFGTLPVWGIQAHPEVDPDTGRAFLQGGIDRWPAHRARFEQALAAPARDSRIGSALVARFLRA